MSKTLTALNLFCFLILGVSNARACPLLREADLNTERIISFFGAGCNIDEFVANLDPKLRVDYLLIPSGDLNNPNILFKAVVDPDTQLSRLVFLVTGSGQYKRIHILEWDKRLNNADSMKPIYTVIAYSPSRVLTATRMGTVNWALPRGPKPLWHLYPSWPDSFEDPNTTAMNELRSDYTRYLLSTITIRERPFN